MAETSSAPTRTVRPWIAALLTFLGWGVGLFYARRTRLALWLTAAQIALVVVVGTILLGALMTQGATTLTLWTPDRWSVVDTLSLLASAVTAIWVWRIAAQRKQVARAGPVRLLGYVAIWLGSILITLILAGALRFFVVQPFRGPSASMAPTIEAGEYFAVAKWSYGYTRFSFAPFDALAPAGRWLARTPARGDVVVFRPAHEPDRAYVKRIVAMPGERVQMIGGVLHINGAPVRRDDIGEAILDMGHGDAQPVRAIRETLPNGAAFTTFDHGESLLDNTREVQVPQGHYFVLGDNRDFSDDSRRSIGFVPLENIVGRAALRD